jgi:threonylcarbamoyladenosine tRNA methylthiotransferase MtaB
MMREACPDMRLRLSSIEPRDVDDDLIDLLASSEGMVCRHLHLPLQSGSTKVLAQMARPYDAAYYADLVQRLYRSVPQLSLSTDIIVGFPGETEQDFLETLAMCRACKFSKVHVFRYSKREGTPAARRVDQVDPQVAAERAQRLTTLAHALRQTGGRKRVGAEELVLVEADGQGMSESYYPVRFSTDALPGDLMRCTFTEFDKDGIFSV